MSQVTTFSRTQGSFGTRIAPWMLAAALAVGPIVATAGPAAAQSRAEARDNASKGKAGPDKPGLDKPGVGKTAEAKNDAKGATPKGTSPDAGPPKAGPPKAGAPKGAPKGRGAGGGRPPGMFVGVDPVRKGPIQQTTPVVGRIVGREGGVVAARTPGPVGSIKVHVGDRVKKGDVLAILVTDLLRAQLEQQRAELRLAKQKVERLERLRSSSSAAFQRALYDDRVQEVARAEAAVRIAGLALKYSKIVAPFDGVVTKRHTDAGAYLPIGGQVVTLINDRNLEIEVDVPADRIGGLLPGKKIRFSTASGRSYVGTVRAIVPEQNPMTRTLAVRITPDFQDTDPGRAINQSVTVDVPIGAARTAVSVHKDGVIARGGGYFVYVILGGKAVPRPIVIGEAVGSRYIVERGLAPGDIVIIRGNERVRPGMPVTFRKGS